MHMSKQNISSHQENDIFLSCSYTSREEFVKEYKKFYNGKAEAKELYLLLLTKLKSAVSVGNVDSFKNLSNLIGYISSIENPTTLRTYYYDTNNPIRNTNLVILSTKRNKVEILKCLFENSEILNNLSIHIGKDVILPDDEDGTCHNAFYYAICSGNVELLDTLINKWPCDYFTAHLEELENILSRSYEELKLKNVLLTDEIEIFVENKLIGLRFFSNNSGKVYSVKDDFNNIKDRVTVVLENIRLLKKEYLNTKNVDEKFLFIAKFIAQNVHILKSQLKSTYDRLPWEEIEFCLVSFVSSHVKQQEINIFFNAALDKGKILNYLENFAKALEDEKAIDDIDISKLALFPDLKREEVVKQIISNNPQFEELYNVYINIRDAYSLLKISSYIELTLLADSETKEGQLVIIRSMQLIGEYLKNTLESPKLSNTTSDFILLSLSRNTRNIITHLRNSLSHAYSLFKRTEIEESADINCFSNIQNDIKKVGIVIGDILHNKKLKVVKELLEKISHSKDQDEVKETADILNNIQICDMILIRGIRSQEEEKVEELIKELKSKMNDKTNYEKKLFNEIDNIINSKKSSFIRFKSDYVLESMDFLFGTKRIDCDGIKAIRNFADDILTNIKPKIVSNNLKEVAQLVMKIYKSYMLKIEDTHMNEIIHKIFFIAEIDSSNIKWIEELHCKLKIGRSEKKKTFQDYKIKEQNYQKILEQKLFTLKHILNKNDLSDQLNEKFSFYKKDGKLQQAVEMLVLDIMSTLSISGNYVLENNKLFLDDYSPLLTGKCLRNHLAHDNALVDSLLSDPSIAIILNAKLLTTPNMIKNKKIIGKLVRDDPSVLKHRYNQNLATIINQEKMFIALENGNLEGLKSCLKQGADINARRRSNLWTALHFAAKGCNLEVVKFILDRNLNIDSKDIDNKNPLHIAASFGSYEIVNYFIEVKGMDVNCLDNRRRTPSLLAAQNGHKNVVKFLLKHNADVNIKDLNGYTPLHYAVKNNHRAVVKSLLEKEKNVDINKTKSGLTSLHIASMNNHLELVKFLLANKANVNAIGYNGWTPLHYIARSGNKSIAYALIKQGADVNAKSIGQGDTPLHIAAENGNIEIIKVLLNNDAIINVESIGNRDTPLHLASEGGHKDIVKTLLDMGADANAKDKDNYTPLHLSALRNDNKEVIEILIKAEANINAKSKHGDTALHFAAMGGYKGVAEILLNMLDDINIKDGDNRTPIELAVLRGHLQIVEMLLKHEKANVNTKGNGDFTLLHIAAHAGNIEIVNCLIEKGADITATTSQGDTPLHLAAGCGHKEVVKTLLENGAKSNSKSSEGFTALHNAAESGYEDIIEILMEKGCYVDSKDDKNCFTPLYIAVLYGNLDSVKTLLDKGANVNAKSSDNITPLYIAAQTGNRNIAEALIKKGADINAADKDNFTPLHIAASEGHNNIVEILLNDANVNAKNSKDGTAIELAVLNGHLQVVQTILHDQRININAKDNNGYTLLHIASQAGKLEIVKYLIEKGADVNIITCHSNTPLHLAVANGYKEITEILIANGADINIKNNQNITVEELESAVAYRNLYDSDSSGIGNTPNNNDLKTKNLFEQILTIREKYYGPNHLKVSEVLTNLGKTEINLHIYQKAKELLERALKIQNKHNSSVETVIVETLENLGNVYEKLGNPQKQKEVLEQALCINEKLYGPNHFEVSIVLVNLSIAYGNLGNLEKKRDLLERALPIQEKHFGADHFQIACVLVNLSNTYAALGDLKTQRNLLERALNIQKRSSHFSIAYTFNNLGGVCLRLGDVHGAKELFEQALLIKEKHFGIDNFELAGTLVNLSTIYKYLGDNKKAKTFLEQALKMEETHYGLNNFKLADTLVNLGILYGDLGDSKKHVELCEKALSIAEGHYGNDNFEVAKVLANLGTAYGGLGNNQKAKELLEQALTIQEKHYGLNNFEVSETLVNLATSYNKLGKHQREKRLLERALEIQEKHGSDHSGVVRTLMKLSLAHRDLGDLQEEKKLIEQALEIQEKYGPDASVVSKILLNLSIVSGKLGDLHIEKTLLERALEIQEKHDHYSLEAVHILQNLGAVYGNLGNSQMAKMLFERALNIQERHYGRDHLEVAATLENLCNTYGILVDPETQKKLLERAISILRKHYGSDHPSVLKILRKMKIINSIINLDINEKSEILQYLQKRLNTATSSGDIQAVQRLLQEGADVNNKDFDGRTSLHYAINNGHIGVVDILLKYGADVTQITNKGNTPLHTAVSKGNKEIVEVLLQHVSRGKLSDFINAKTISGNTTSLHVAAKNGFLDIVKSLMKHGATYDIENKEGKTPLDLSIDMYVVYLLKFVNELFENAKNGNLDIIGKLKTAKPDEIEAVTNVRNNKKCTLIQVAIANRHMNIANKISEIIKEQENQKVSK